MEPIDLKQPDPYYALQYERVRREWEGSTGDERIRLTEALSVIEHQKYCRKSHRPTQIELEFCTDPLLV